MPTAEFSAKNIQSQQNEKLNKYQALGEFSNNQQAASHKSLTVTCCNTDDFKAPEAEEICTLWGTSCRKFESKCSYTQKKVQMKTGHF